MYLIEFYVSPFIAPKIRMSGIAPMSRVSGEVPLLYPANVHGCPWIHCSDPSAVLPVARNPPIDTFLL